MYFAREVNKISTQWAKKGIKRIDTTESHRCDNNHPLFGVSTTKMSTDGRTPCSKKPSWASTFPASSAYDDLRSTIYYRSTSSSNPCFHGPLMVHGKQGGFERDCGFRPGSLHAQLPPQHTCTRKVTRRTTSWTHIQLFLHTWGFLLPLWLPLIGIAIHLLWSNYSII